MNSREIVRRTLDFDGPERVARSFGGSDFAGSSGIDRGRRTAWREVGGGRWEMTDEWGNTWARVDATSKGEVVKGVLDDLDHLDSYQFPDYSSAAGFEKVRASRLAHPDKWLNGWMPGFAFNIARKMRKLENYLMDIMLEREKIAALHDRIDKMLEAIIRQYAAAGVDGVMFPEDWGTQSQTLVSPALWHEEFFPRFKHLCGVAHSLGIRVFMHSCGQTEAIVPGLMDAGIDCLQFDQPDLHGLDNLASHQARGKITFWCPVDIQKTLPIRDEAVIRAKATEMLDKLWRGRGGFVAGRYEDEPSIGLEPQWQRIACETFVERGVRENYRTS